MGSGHIGMDKTEIDTPALLIDLDVLDRNIKTMADYYAGKKAAVLLPHQKGHRLPIIGRKQIHAGAKGVSMTSLGLAEYYVNSGIDDVFITSEIYGTNKIARLCAISKHANAMVGVDNLKNVKQLSEIALSNDTKINVAVELYVGSGAGVEMREAKTFVREIENFRGVNFRGLWWHQGALNHVKSWAERKNLTFQTLDRVAALKDEVEDAGVSVEMLSGGFTCTWNITPEYPRLNNIMVQAGSYVFSDWCSHLLEGLEAFDYALTVLTRCVSRPTVDEAVFDFGMNSCSDECTYDYRAFAGPKFKKLEGYRDVIEREEVTVVKFESPRKDVAVGDVFEVVPPHSDTTAKLHDTYYAIRDNKVEAIWPNYARGLL
jgi:D-serine deaminase-like pyridoxal phosphate-dependent protein